MLENQRRTILTLELHPSIIVNLTLSIGIIWWFVSNILGNRCTANIRQWKYNIIFVINPQAPPLFIVNLEFMLV